ncbi:MAG: alpha/beta fold hydrolase [Chitinophagales bacterium]
MPLIKSQYRAPFLFRNGNLNTIAAAMLRQVKDAGYTRERIITPDDDFLDLDWLNSNSKKIALLIHGLEASAGTPYMKGMAKALFRAGYKAVAMNLRGCSGVTNHRLRAYHCGATDDVATVINHVLQHHECEELVLIGFSLGGNLVLKYLGENGNSIPPQIKKAMVISAPCDLEAASAKLDDHSNFIYRNRFLVTLRNKALERIHCHGFDLPEKDLASIKTFREYDDRVTAPLFGFADASDYYSKSSSKNFIQHITIPALILTARDDPFFTPACFPFEECHNHEKVILETPDHGGHAGFILDLPWGNYFSEQRAIEFFNDD